MSVYNKKDIVRINQEIGETGEFQNDSSLSFALSIVKQKKSWLYELSYLLRSLLIDHTFIDGNKRTAYMLCILYFEDYRMNYEKEDLVETIHKIAKRNIKDINKIGRMLRKCWKPKD